MSRSLQKNSRLQARIAALERELRQVGSSIDQLDRAVSHPDREAAVRQLRDAAERRQRREVEPEAEEDPSAVDSGDPAVESSAPSPSTGPDAEAVDSSRSARDDRFASYFVTGSLQSVRPLRTERKIQRNKAIFMVVVAVVVVYGVIHLLF